MEIGSGSGGMSVYQLQHENGSDLFLIVVVVGASEKVPKNELGDIDALPFVDLHRNASPAVENGNGVRRRADVHLDCVHGRVPHFVIGSVHEDFVKYLVEPGNEGNRLQNHFLILHDPHGLLLVLCAADIGVWPQKNVLQLRHLLVDFLHGSPIRTSQHVGRRRRTQGRPASRR